MAPVESKLAYDDITISVTVNKVTSNKPYYTQHVVARSTHKVSKDKSRNILMSSLIM